jgi:hypothetical protein
MDQALDCMLLLGPSEETEDILTERKRKWRRMISVDIFSMFCLIFKYKVKYNFLVIFMGDLWGIRLEMDTGFPHWMRKICLSLNFKNSYIFKIFTIIEGLYYQFKLALGLTIFLGIYFTMLQGLEYYEATQTGVRDSKTVLRNPRKVTNILNW